MKKALVLASLTLVVAVLVASQFGGPSATVYASRLAGISAAGVTGITVQNLDATQQADLIADFYKQPDGDHTQIPKGPVEPGAVEAIWLPGEPTLTNGAYAAIISANRKIAAIARTDWETTGGAGIYSNVDIGTDVVVPLAAKAFNGQTSIISIQNSDISAAATVDVELYQTGETAAVWNNSYSIPPGTSVTLDFSRGDFLTLADGYLGYMRATSATPIGVQAFMDFDGSMGVAAYEGIPVDMAAETLYAPLFRSRQESFGSYLDTGISVVNPGASAVDVTVTYYGAGACAGTVIHPTVSVGAGESKVIYQGPGGGHGLPTNCYGTAKVEATGPVMAIVNDSTDYGAGGSATFNAVAEAQTGLTVALPLWRRNFANLTTGISAMNTGSGPATVTISFSAGGTTLACPSGCTQTVAPGAGVVFWPGAIGSLSDGQFGGATITSDQPIAVIVNDTPVGGAAKDAATYNGLTAD